MEKKTVSRKPSSFTTKKIFDKVQNILTGKFHPHKSGKVFYFNNLIKCGVCSCKFLGEEKKNKYKYYHRTFSKGRHPGSEYIREERLAEMFEEPIKRITLNDEIAEWLMEGLKGYRKDNLELQGRRYNVLKNQCDKINNRLSKLYDSKFDGEINEDVFKAKEEEYKRQLIEIKSQMASVQIINSNVNEYSYRTLELSKDLYSQYVRTNYEDKSKILKFIASNYVLNDVSLYPTYRKPFTFIAEGLSHTSWLPR
ncbi:MAG: cassette chromosome recombinase B [Candidatus Jettenia ecosi]|uniref:Cassette chromosome recombinase B n=1 Tax=Candidatus Jettenia ecosi TaxID=2494326 RepID=A0A533QDH8_9BACT|nr:MAG: cassette chromosome recombinase B [Candidatus Jettenia ecosi]